MVKFTWMNHASFITEADGVRLISDPWIEGRVFNESWAHISPTKFTYEDFKDITHIWFSHEHPDHFFPPNIKKIPADIRANITVLYQETIDKKVKDYCTKAGFKAVIELIPWKPYNISENITLTCAKVRNDTDSWFLFKYKNFCYLNLNDCLIMDTIELKPIKEVAGDIDVMFTQFSFANWSGNKGDDKALHASAQFSLNKMTEQIRYLKPKTVVPFASYVWFCHVDNFYMNAYANNVRDVYALIENELHTTCVVLYNGETWIYGQEHDSKTSINKYQADIYNVLNNPKLTIPQSYTAEALKESCDKYIATALSMNNKRKLLSYRPFYAYVTDLNKSFAVSFKNGLQEVARDMEHCDIALHSQSLKYCFDFIWGYGTIQIASTYQVPVHGNWRQVYEYQWIAELNAQGKKMGGIWHRALVKAGILKA